MKGKSGQNPEQPPLLCLCECTSVRTPAVLLFNAALAGRRGGLYCKSGEFCFHLTVRLRIELSCLLVGEFFVFNGGEESDIGREENLGARAFTTKS